MNLLKSDRTPKSCSPPAPLLSGVEKAKVFTEGNKEKVNHQSTPIDTNLKVRSVGANELAQPQPPESQDGVFWVDPFSALKVIPIGDPIKVHCGCGVVLPRAAPPFDICIERIDQRRRTVKKQIAIPP